MNNLFGSIKNFFQFIPQMSRAELKGYRNSFIILVIILYAMMIIKLLFNSYTFSSITNSILWIFSIYTIFNIRRITTITVAGEALEVSRITPTTSAQNAAEGSAAAVVSPLSSTFWNVSLQVFFFVSIAALATPLLPLRNNWILVLILPTLAVAIAIAFQAKALRLINWLSGAFIVGLAVAHVFLLFAPNVQDASGVVTTSASKGFQNFNTYRMAAGTKVYALQGKIMMHDASLVYAKDVEVISLNKAHSQNGAVYEMVGLPDPATGQPGARVGWVFSGDLKPAMSSPATTVTKTVVVTTPPVIRMMPSKPAVTSLPATSPVSGEERWNMQFYRGNQKFEQEVSVVRSGNNILMRTVADNTVFRGTLDGDYYRGTLEGGGTSGKFNVCFSGETAYGNLSANENLSFSMKRFY